MINVENENFVWKKYWDKNNFFNLFDVGKYDAKNRLLILGRNDDVINIRGHRIGTGEIESTILQINEVIEACAIPVSDKLEGHRICLFLVCKKDRKKNVEDKINSKLIENFGTFAIPKQTYFVSSLPKTRSGKIIRRVIRDIVENKSGKKNLGDLSTLLDKKSVLEIIKLLKKDIN